MKYSDPFGFKKALNTKSLDKLNKKQLDQLTTILKKINYD
tara:strand:+ start:123 stop:242 length:120 start_codon:yes stop_codon:yes gene_type:complete